MQKKIIKVTTLRGMGAEIGIWAQEQKQIFTLHLFCIVLIFEPDDYITYSTN